jgi:hypothetical protein
MKSTGALACLIAGGLATSAWGQHVVKNPDWLKKPTASSLIAVYPTAALRKGVAGSALIHCVVTIVGSLRDCLVVREDPPDMGFGAAAIALTPQFEMTPGTIDGKPFEAKVNIPINWERPSATVRALGSRIPTKPEPGETVLSQVSWSAAPTVAQVSEAYPQKARVTRIGGLVTLSCSFGHSGSIRDCMALDESPKGYGFGRAAKSLASDFSGPASLSDGRSTYQDSTQIVVAFSPEMIDGKSPVIGVPIWTHLPSALDMAAALPKAASAAHVDAGHVVLGCDVAAGGHLANCTIQKETPEGLGLGAAALALSGQFQVSVWTAEGLPTVGGHVNVPIRYDLGNSAGAPPAKP